MGLKVQGTVKGWEPFIPEFIDCELLHKAFKGFGRTDEATIIQILSTRNSKQRQQLRHYYKKKYDKDLVEQLKSELMGDFWKLVQALMISPIEYDAQELHKALKGVALGFGKDESCVVEILTSRSKEQLADIQEQYEKMYHCKLWQDVTSETSGEFRKFLVDLINNNRESEDVVNVAEAVECARRIHSKEGDVLRSALVSQSHAQLQEVFKQFTLLTGLSIEEEIDTLPKNIQKEFKMALKSFVQISSRAPQYYAEQLYHSMKGLGTNDRTLIRLVVTRSEVDMVQIKEEFSRMYKQKLEGFIADDTSGDYRKLLMALVGGTSADITDLLSRVGVLS